MYIIIVNNMAGKGKGLQLLRSLEKEPMYKRLNCRSFLTEFSGHAEKIASQVAGMQNDKLKGVIVIGGDGTFHEVMNGLTNFPSVPLGFLPEGSGNDFARGIGLKGKNEQVFKKMLSSMRPVSYWLGVYLTGERDNKYKRFFVNSIGWGIDAEIVKSINKERNKKVFKHIRLVSLAYVFALFKCLWRFDPFSIKLTMDGKDLEFEKVWMVVISNHPYFGGGMKINPFANPSSNQFGVMILHNVSKWKILSLFGLVFIGKHTHLKEVKIFQAAKVDLFMENQAAFQVDGEIGSCKSCHIWKDSHPKKIFTG